MKKFLGLLSMGLIVAVMSGCGLNPASAPGKVTITLSGIGGDTVFAGGAAVPVSGTIVSDSDLTNVEMSFLDLSGNTVSSSDFAQNYFTANYTGLKTVDLHTDLQMQVMAYSGTPAGRYQLKITASGGSISGNSSKTFTVIARDIDTATVTIGSYNNPTTGSSIDLDNGTVMTSDIATLDGSGVDLVATYSSYYSAFRIFNPVYAADSSNVNAFAGWVNPAATTFCKITGTAFDDINTKAQIQSLYYDGTPITSATCSTGDIFVVKTDLDNYVAIQINSFDQDIGGTATIKWGK